MCFDSIQEIVVNSALYVQKFHNGHINFTVEKFIFHYIYNILGHQITSHSNLATNVGHPWFYIVLMTNWESIKGKWVIFEVQKWYCIYT